MFGVLKNSLLGKDWSSVQGKPLSNEPLLIGQTSYNVAVIGKTGVGKSSLINYLYDGKCVAETGFGKPITPNGFHMFKHQLFDMPVNIFDSWGLEAGKEDEWLRQLDSELEKRSIHNPVSSWFHSIFYCISASEARIENADVRVIKKLVNAKYKVSIILTKSDALQKEPHKLDAFKKAILDSLVFPLPIIAVCSEGKKTRVGEVRPFDKAEVETQSFLDLIDSLELRIPAHCEAVMKTILKKWRSNMALMIRGNIGFMGNGSDAVQSRLSEESKSLISEILNTGRDTQIKSLKYYAFIAKHLMGEIQLYGKSQSVLYIKFGGDYNDWSIPFAIFAVFALPFAIIHTLFKGKDEAIEKLINTLDEFVLQVEREIDIQIIGLSSSLNAICKQAKEDFLSL